MANTATSLYTPAGTGNYIELDFNPATQLVTNTWTIEFWVYNPTGYFISSYNGTHGFYAAIDGTNQIYVNNGGVASSPFSGGIGLSSTGGWQHVAIVRNGMVNSAYLNGALKGSHYSNSRTTTAWGGGKVRLGVNGTDATDGVGYFDEIRFSKAARYGNIDVNKDHTTKNYTQVAGRGQNAILPHHVKLYVAADANTAVDSTTVLDRTGNHPAGTVTNNSKYTVAPQGWPGEGLNALYFDGAEDKVSFAASPSHAVAANEDYSVEFWVKHYDDLDDKNNQYWFNQGNAFAWKSYRDNIGFGTEDYFQLINGTTTILSAPFVSLGQWVHAAVGRVNNVHCAWINGQLAAANTSGTGNNIAATIDGTAVIALGQFTSGTDQDCQGWLDKVRVCVGQSAYTPHFTPYGAQKNVVHNRGEAITDARLASANTHAIQMGRAAIGSDAATNANTYCLDFDGTGGSPKGDHYVSYGKDRFESKSKFSIFGWIYVDAVSGTEGNSILFGSDSTDGNKWWSLYITTTGYLQFYSRNGSPISTVTASSGQFTGGTLGVWKSVGATHDGTTTTLYVDGTSVGSGSQEGWDYGSGNLNILTIGAINKSVTANADVEGEFDGKMIGLAMWSGTAGSLGVLTAAQISALHSAGKSHDLTTATGVYTASEIDDLAAYWRFGNHYLDTTETLYDVSGNDHSVHAINTGTALTYTTGTTFNNNWQHRGYFTPDKYTSLLLQSSTNEGATSFLDTGPGFKRVEFDGTDDRANKTSLTNYRSSDTVGSIVAWVKIGTAKDNNAIFCYGDTGGSADYFYLSVISNNKVNFQPVVSASSRGGSIYGGSVLPGKWSMVALTYDDTQYRIYVDGVEVTTTNGLTGTPDGTETWFNDLGSGVFDAICVGALLRNSDVHEFDGQIAGVGVWSSTLTASQISAMHDLGPGGNWKTDYSSGLVDYWTFGNQIGEGTDTASTIYSQVTSGNDLTTSGTMAVPFAGHTITRTGAIHKTGKSVYGGSSIYFDGSDDYLATPAGPEWNLPLGTSFTIELWMLCANPTTNFTRVMAQNSGTNVGWALHFDSTSGGIQFGSDSVSIDTSDDLFDTTVIATNVWYHVAVSYDADANAIGLYVDGVEANYQSAYNATQPIKNWWTQTVDGEVYIGRRTGSPGYYYQGYMDEIRISSGIARYSKSIERFANTFVAKGDTGDAFTYLQINSNGAKNGAIYSDTLNRTGFGTTAMTVGSGNPIWKNIKGDPHGGANTALYFDGTSYLTVADTTNHDFAAADDATFEIWVNFDDVSATKHIYGCGGEGNGGNPDGWSFRYNPNTSYSTHGFYMNLDWASPYTQAATGPADEEFKVVDRWYHCAVIKKGTLWSLYTDGVLKSSVTYSPAVNTATAFRLGYAHDGHGPNSFKGYIDGFRISRGIARYGKSQLGTAQQTHVSANSDSGVITSNSTFGSANNIFETDGHTVMLLNGDELYANTLVVSGAHTFHRNVGGNNVSNVTTTFATSVQANVERVGGTTGNVYTINGALRPTDLVLVRDNHYNFQITDSNYSSHPFKFSTTSGGTHSPGGTEYTTGITVDQTTQASNTIIKFSPTSATPDTLYYYCSSHNLMGGQITVTDSTGSDGKIATQPFAMFKGDGTAAAGGPTQRHGFSAYGANSYLFDGTDLVRTSQGMVGGGTTINDNFDFGKEDFTIEYWESPNVAGPDHVWCLAGGGPAAQRVFEGYYYANGLFNLVYGLGGTSSPNFNSYYNTVNEWTHIAIQGRWSGGTGNIEVWKNGNLHTVTGSSFTTAMNSLSTISSGSPGLYIGGLYGGTGSYEGFFDSWRISKGIARYGYSGTNAKLGTNAVHHSHAKLLITSNTFSGNTHFDDFSEQGNYWNQQPLSYYFDGTDNYIDVGSSAPVSDYPFTFSFWFNPNAVDGAYLGGMFDEGSGTIGYSVRTGTSGEAVLRRRNSGDRLATTSANSLELDNWHHVLAVYTNDTSSAIYVDGEISATNTDSEDFNTAVDNLVWGGERDSSPGSYLKGRLSSAAMWSAQLTQANARSMWALGPAGNLMTDFSDNILVYHAMGNHNDLGGRPADTASTVYDRSGNGRDGVTAGTMTAPNKGKSVIGTNVYHSTDVKNFGSSSIYFEGGDSPNYYIDVPNVGTGTSFMGITTGDFTIETWWRQEINTSSRIFTSSTDDHTGFAVDCSTAGALAVYWSDNGTSHNIHSNLDINVTLDFNDWVHVTFQRSAGQFQVFKNGMLTYSAAQTASLRLDGALRIGNNHDLGGDWGGYMDEFGVYSTAKYNPVATGLGTSTITPSYLDDPTGNHFTPTGLAITDQMLDSPENNFCTFNAVAAYSRTFTEGNLAHTGTTANDFAIASMAFTKGKWYHEVKASGTHGASHSRMGFYQYTGKEQYQSTQGAGAWGDYGSTVYYMGVDNFILGTDTDATHVNHAVTHADAAGDVYMFAMDLDDPDGKAWFGVNGVWFAGNPAKGEDPPLNSSRLKDPLGNMAFSSAPWTFAQYVTDNSITATVHANFGQGDPDGENNYTDSNGRGGFRFEPPSGFLSWCTANMKDADFAPIGPNSAAGTPDKHFDTLLYTDTYAAGRLNRVGGLNFKPDFVWIKCREGTESHSLNDTVRGVNKRLMLDSAAVEGAGGITEFTEDGFVGSAGYGSDGDSTGHDFVAWCWKAGNDTTENFDGTLTVKTSVNQDAGFSIITGTTANVEANDMAETFGHGLDTTPEVLLFRNLEHPSGTQHARVFFPPLTTTNLKGLPLSTGALFTNGSYKTFEINGNLIGIGREAIEHNGDRFVCYAWHSVEGYSKFGSYEGNNNADGTFVYLGFKPAWVMIKNVDATGNWQILDNKRNTVNPANDFLRANSTAAESSNYDVDFLSNGIKLRNTDQDYNTAHTFFYMAFAEMPFKYANAR